MRYQLYTGKTVPIPLSIYLDLTDEEFEMECQDLIAHNYGDDSDDIWEESILKVSPGKADKKKDPLEDTSIIEDPIVDLFSLTSSEKLLDLDLPLDIIE